MVQVWRVFRQLRKVRVVRLVRLPQVVPLNQGNPLTLWDLDNQMAPGFLEAQVVQVLGLQRVVRVVDREGKRADKERSYNMLSW